MVGQPLLSQLPSNQNTQIPFLLPSNTGLSFQSVVFYPSFVDGGKVAAVDLVRSMTLPLVLDMSEKET